jgi:glucose/arabinose dehydrogenase/fibronectin type 3 domain-containing protein/uncharacterized protein (DUF2249 family)
MGGIMGTRGSKPRERYRNVLIYLLALFTAATTIAAVSETPPAQAAPSNFTTETVVSGLTQPVSIGFLPDGRSLVLQKNGIIVIGDPSTVPMQTETYLEFANIDSANERGLLEITFDPDFATNGYFYLYYTPSAPQRARISRFTHVENTGGTTSRGDISSEFVVWEDTSGYTSCCHYGGGLDVGPDGKLWLTTGEKFVGARSQDLTDAGGKIIRVNLDGTIPDGTDGWPGNPFADGEGGNHDAIWAYGLRNPFRAKWDLPTGRFFIGEVGGNNQNAAWEDVHIARAEPAYAGVDYGWPGCEGLPPYDDFPSCTIEGTPGDPIFAYAHTGDGASVTGGVVYRGSQFPAEFDGAYFYGDYARNLIRYLTFDATGTTVTGDYEFETNAGLPVALEVGPDGYLYSVDIMGVVRRYVYQDGNQAPVILTADAAPTATQVGTDVDFTGVAFDNEGDPLTYTWHFGDSASATGTNVTHQYTSDGLYQAYLEVSDAEHVTVSQTIAIQVGDPPVASIDTPVSGSLFLAGDEIPYAGSAVDGAGNPITDPDAFSWVVAFIHNFHTHPEFGPVTGLSGSIHVPSDGHDFGDSTGFRISLTVTDVNGIQNTTVTEIYPDKVDVTLETSPPGLTVELDGIPYVTPLVKDTLIGFQHTIEARTPQCKDGLLYNFSGWSDGGAASHLYTVPTVNGTVTATYSEDGVCAAPVEDGLVMRLKGDLGVTAPSGGVTSWSDLSGHNNDMAPTTGSPTLVTSELEGHDVIRFDGVDDGLGRTLANEFPLANSDRSVFMVTTYRGWSNTGSGAVGFTWGEDTCNSAFGLTRTDDGDLGVQGWCGSNDFDSNVNADGAGWITQSVVLGGDLMNHYKNGELIDVQTHAFGTNPGKIRIGASMRDTRWVDMDVAEVLVYDRALTDEERQEIEDYFGAEYFGIDPNAPAVTITSPDNASIQTTNDVTVSWTTAGTMLPDDHVHLVLDGSPPHVTVLDQNGSYTFEDLDDGPHTVAITIASGTHVVYQHPKATATVDFEVDSDPTVTITGPADGSVSKTNDVSVSWSAVGELQPGDHVHVTIDDAPDHLTILELDGSYTFTSLDDGAHTVKVEIANLGHVIYGNPEATAVNAFAVNTAPEVTIISPADGSLQASTNVAVTWRTTGDSAPGDVILLTLDGAATPVTVGDLDGSHTFSDLDDGAHSVLVELADTTGVVYSNSEASALLAFTVNTAVPVTDGLVLQLESDLNVTTIGAFGAAGWLDQSGNGNDLTSAGDPMIGLVKTPSRLPAIRFDGSGDSMDRTDALTGFSAGNNNRTIFLVARYLGADVWGGASYGAGVANQTFGLVARRTTGELALQGWGSGNDLATIEPGVGAGWLTQSAVLSSGAASLYRDGALIGAMTHVYDTVLTRMALGEEISGLGNVEMDVAAVMVYNRALSGVERQMVGDYLESKYLTIVDIAPEAPTGLEAIPGDGQVVLRWDTHPEIDVVGYDVYRSGSTPVDTTATPINGATPVSDVVYLDTATDNGTEYFYSIVAIDATDHRSGASAEASATPQIDYPPEAPSGLGAIPGVNEIELSWVPPSDIDVVGYYVYRSTSSPVDTSAVPINGGALVADFAFLDTGVLNDVEYFYTVSSVDFGGNESVPAVEVSATPALPDCNAPVPGAIVLCLESDVGVLSSNGVVTTWEDQSNAGNDLTATGDPKVDAATTPLGLPAVSFDGTDDAAERFAIDGIAGLPSGSADRTMFSIVKYNDASSYGGAAYGNGGSNKAFGLVVNGSQGFLSVQGWGSGNDAISATAGTGAGWLSQSAVVSDGNLRHYKDGVPIHTVIGRTYATDVERIRIGRELGGGAFVDIDVAAVLIYDRALSSAERQQVEDYLQDKYLTTDDAPPSAPTGLTAVSGDGEVALTWDPHGEADVVGFDLYRSTSLPVDTSVVPINGATLITGTSHTDTTVVNGTEYFFTVVAVDGSAQESTPAVSVSATPAVPACAAPLAGDAVLCLESDVGISESSGAVLQWADQSTRANHLEALGNPTLGTTPSYLPAISLDGTGDVLERLAVDGITGLPSGSADRTMFSVVKYDGVSSYAGAAYGDGAINQAFGLIVAGSGGMLAVQGWGTGNDVVSFEPGTGAGWVTQSAVVSGNSLTHFKDGNLIDAVDPRVYATDVTTLRVGQEISGGGYADMDIAAVLIYDRALSDIERQQVEDYLHDKYLIEGDIPPAVPSGLVAVAGDGEVGLTWDTHPEADVAGFDVFRSTSSPVDTSETALNGAALVAGTTFTDTAVVNGAEYFYTVVAVDSADQASPPAAEVSAQPVLDLVPGAPSGLSGVAGDGEVVLSWDTHGEADVVGFDVFGSVVSPVDTSGASLNGGTLVTGTGYTDVSVTNGTEYFYTVVAVDAGGQVSPGAVEVSVTPVVSLCGAPLSGSAVLCLESDTGVVSSGGVVSGWDDQSTAGNSLVALGDPTIDTATTPSNLAAVSFDGNGDVLERVAGDGIVGLPSGNADRTMFTVIKYDAASKYAGAAYGNSGQNKAFGLVVNSSSGFLTVQGYGSSHDVVSSEPGTGTGWLSQSAIVSGNVLTHYRDGVLIDTRDPRSYATDVAAIRLGQEISGRGFVNVDIAVVLIYDRALSDTERQQVEDYLQTKYLTMG